MKTTRYAIIGAAALLFAAAVPTFAIEGLHVSVQSSNAVLSWPSDYDSGETFLVQYRQTLNATDAWQTLADYLPADYGTNFTFFTHSNVVHYPPPGAGGGTNIGNISPFPFNSMAAPMPLAMPANGSGAAVPLALYPPGLDLSGFTIFDPATGESVSGNDYVRSAPSIASRRSAGFQPMDEEETSSDTNQYTGFYRVVRDGAHLFGLTNGTVLSGVVTIPVELANDGGSVSSVSITEADAPVGDSVQTVPSIAPLAMTLNTTLMSNGVHQISASARWDDTNGGLWEADSPPVSVTISNEVSFENWMPSFGELGNTLLIRATSAHPVTDWQIDVYDSQYAYVGSFVGHTDDGDISVVWNLVDYYGVAHTNDNFFICEVSTEYADPPSPPTFKVTDPWAGAGAWVIVAQHAWDGTLDHDLLYAELSGFIGGALGVGWTVLPPPQGRDQYDNWFAYGLTFGAENPQGDTDWQNFRNALYDPRSRNLVYFGHGGPNALGYNPQNLNRFITSAEIADHLHTIPAGQTNRHAFRFVFLDGCQTAKGNLPEAFGIIHRENVDLDDYIAASMRPSAFAGWNAEKWITFLFGNYINYEHVTFISAVQTQMLLGDGIHDAIQNAAHNWNVVFSFNWINQMAVYGFWDLHFGQYNN